VKKPQKIYTVLEVSTSTLGVQLFIYGEFYDQQILSTQILLTAHFDTGFSIFNSKFETLISLLLIQ
jgi:hypothetical protein